MKREIAILGDLDSPELQALLEAGRSGYRPHQVVAAGLPEDRVPLLHGRKLLDGKATAYVCVGFACRQPVNNPQLLSALLNERL